MTILWDDDPDVEKLIDNSLKIGELLDKIIVKYGANWREDLKGHVGLEALLYRQARGEEFDHTDSDIYVLNYLKENLGEDIPEVYEYEQLLKKGEELFVICSKKKGIKPDLLM